MSRKLTWLSVLFFSLYYHDLFAQHNGISINERTPEIIFTNLINYSKKTLKSSDLKGRLLIIDFWATWCVPCIASFPKLDSLQKQFQEKIQIISVTDQGLEEVQILLQKLKRQKGISPVVMADDTLLKKLFPFRSLPHYVWISNGKVVGITEGNDVTEGNIRLLLAGETTSLKLKKDNLDRPVNAFGPLYSLGMPTISNDSVILEEVRPDKVDYFSVITKGFTSGEANGSLGNKDSTRISCLVTSIENLYLFALATKFNADLIYSRRIKLFVNDTSLFTTSTSGKECIDWLKTHGYSYELIVPEELSSKRQEIMLGDLNRYFGAVYNVEGKLEKFMVPALVLQRIDSNMELISDGGDFKVIDSPYGLLLQNAHFGWVAEKLKFWFQNYKMAILDETGITSKVDLEINTSLSNLDSVNKELKRYGVEFMMKERLVDFVVIREKTN